VSEENNDLSQPGDSSSRADDIEKAKQEQAQALLRQMQLLESFMADLMQKQESVLRALHEVSHTISNMGLGVAGTTGVPSGMETYAKSIPDDIRSRVDPLGKERAELESLRQEYEKKLHEKSHTAAELAQEKIILQDMADSLNVKAEELENKKQELEKELQAKSHASVELEQEKMALSEMLDTETTEKHTIQRKHYISIGIAAMVIAASFGGFLYYESVKNAETQKILLNAVKSKYLVQNLKGDTVDTWVSWVLVGNKPLFINIINTDKAPKDKVDAIKDVLLSKETIEVDDSILHKEGPGGTKSTLYKGWIGALAKASEKQTKLNIPKDLQVIESDKGEGDITIELTNLKDNDGYAGYTNSIVDQNQILKARITLYEVDKQTPEKIATVLRHELGHALGLGHSTATEDLMAPVVNTPYPYISDCDIAALQALYDDKKSSEVVCQK